MICFYDERTKPKTNNVMLCLRNLLCEPRSPVLWAENPTQDPHCAWSHSFCLPLHMVLIKDQTNRQTNKMLRFSDLRKSSVLTGLELGDRTKGTL